MLNQLAQYTYQTTEVSTNSTGFLAFMAGIWIFILVLAALNILALWKVFNKAGIPGWKAIIPVYNAWLFYELAGKPGWWALITLGAFIPLLGFIAVIAQFVLYCIAVLEIGKAFGKSTTFSVVALILFNVVGMLILGFDDSKYTKPATAPANFS